MSSTVVIPGQVIITSSTEGGDGFLRGHGTYIEGGKSSSNSTSLISNREESESVNDDSGSEEGENETMEDVTQQQLNNIDEKQSLIASVAGTIERTNKLITVQPFSPMPYNGQVGDLVIGRITSVQATRWKVYLGSSCREGTLPLAGVNLPGGIQRIRTSEDAFGMRRLYVEGDLVSAEVQAIQHSDGVCQLLTRSLKYGKLENGCLVVVPPKLIVRRKQHFVTLPIPVDSSDISGVDVILGTNGFVYIQRTIPKSWKDQYNTEDGGTSIPFAETLQKLRKRHRETPVLPEERQNIARVRNSIEALKLVHRKITPETIMEVFSASVESGVSIKDMLKPAIIAAITKGTRRD